MIKRIELGKVYTVEQAAKRLKLEQSHVRRLLKSGDIKGEKWGRDWIVVNLNYKRKRKDRRELMDFILKARCPINHDVIPGIAHSDKSVWAARNAGVSCPHHDNEGMEIVEVADSNGKILWQDRVWVREEIELANEIDNIGKKKAKRKAD